MQWAHYLIVSIIKKVTGFYLLKPSQKSTMKIFYKNSYRLKAVNYCRKKPIVDSGWVLNTPLYYLLAKVHRISTKQSTKSFFFL